MYIIREEYRNKPETIGLKYALTEDQYNRIPKCKQGYYMKIANAG